MSITAQPTDLLCATTDLRYLAAGNGTQAVVFIHGWSAFKEIWWSAMAALAPYARSYAPDLPGHGGSARHPAHDMADLARVITDFCTARGLHEVTLVGHSMGGNIAVELALIVGLCAWIGIHWYRHHRFSLRDPDSRLPVADLERAGRLMNAFGEQLGGIRRPFDVLARQARNDAGRHVVENASAGAERRGGLSVPCGRSRAVPNVIGGGCAIYLNLASLQGFLAAGVSHEIRSPLARLRVLAELLQDGSTTPDLHHKIEREVAEIDDLVGKLLASSRLDFSKRHCDGGPFKSTAGFAALHSSANIFGISAVSRPCSAIRSSCSSPASTHRTPVAGRSCVSLARCRPLGSTIPIMRDES
ncbi:MAG: alpha/beta fold hydrolase, partial [Rhodobacteraceae bacterium]|nr:alpha/beta fold hydrolase [Paracoccaceae bacterium]